MAFAQLVSLPFTAKRPKIATAILTEQGRSLSIV